VATINPDTAEACNGRDDNCNGAIDEGVSVTLYDDVDGDNHGAPGTSHIGCVGEPETALLGNDCDDFNPAIQPGSMICGAQGNGAVKICSPYTTPSPTPPGSYADTSCPQGLVCLTQPNGTGDCVVPPGSVLSSGQ
jgi:hypothetical protein